MKSSYLIYTFLLCSTLFSCNCIEESERFIEVPPPTIRRNILIEDFTGQKCIACPYAADEAHKLQTQYGVDKVIVVGIHAGDLALKALATATGEEYAKYWKIEKYPSGLIDRKNGIHDYTKWSAYAYNLIQEESPLELSIQNTFDTTSKQLKVQVAITGKEACAGKLQIWLTESKIQAVQYMPDGKPNMEYIHNHVFRTTVNGTWGEDIQIAKDEEKKVSHELTLESKWKPENISIVAFVYNDEGVQQTETRDIQ